MTTPKQPTLAMRMAIHSDAQRPFRELAEEFRRLAAEAKQRSLRAEQATAFMSAASHGGQSQAFKVAASMLEEALNGVTVVVQRGIRPSDIRLPLK